MKTGKSMNYQILPILFITIGTAAWSKLIQLRQLMDIGINLRPIKVLHFDTDGTRNFPHLAAPFDPEKNEANWGANSFIHIPLPNRDFVRSINNGLRPGFDNIHPTAFDTVGEGVVGVGGNVLLASAITNAHYSKIRGAIRRVLKEITSIKNELSTADTSLNIHEIAGCLGGTRGALENIHDIIVDEAHKMGISVSFNRIMLFPGVHLAKDPENSLANSAAWIREFSARASGRYIYLSYGKNGEPTIKTAPVVPTWVISDTNNAPGTASTISTKELFSSVAHYLHLQLTTPLESRLDQMLVDFQGKSLKTNKFGEGRVAQSIGVSHITFNREYVAQSIIKKSVQRTLEHWLRSANSEEIIQNIENFVRDRRLREGADFSELSSALSSNKEVNHVSRFRHLFNQSLENFSEIELLEKAPEISKMTQTQTMATAQTHMEESRFEFVGKIGYEIEHHTEHSIWAPELGISAALAWLTEGKRITSHMAVMATKNKKAHEQLISLEENTRTIEEEDIPNFLNMKWVVRLFKLKSIQEKIRHYIELVQQLGILRLKNIAQTQAAQTLEEISEAFESQLTQVTQVREELTSTVATVKDELKKIKQSDQAFINPKGIALDGDLEELYSRILFQIGNENYELAEIETRFANELLIELKTHHNLFELCKNPGQLKAELEQLISKRIRPHVETLHVQTELIRRYNDKQLETFFRERDRESHEFLPLDGCVEYDNTLHVVRLVCGDRLHGSHLTEMINQVAYDRADGNARYEFIDTGNPERLTLIQLRLCVPPSSIASYKVCRDTYEQVRKEMTYESMYTDLVGSFLPEPGVVATFHDAQVALVKALAINILQLDKSNGVPALKFCQYTKQLESVTSSLEVFKQFNTRVEITTRFWCEWRLHSPAPIRKKIQRLKALILNIAQNPTTIEKIVSSLISKEALQTVLEELEFYDRNTNPLACLWYQNKSLEHDNNHNPSGSWDSLTHITTQVAGEEQSVVRQLTTSN